MRQTFVLLVAGAILVGFFVSSGTDKTQSASSNTSAATPDQPKTDPIKAAALYAGMITGMAIICRFDSKPVMQSYKAFLQHHSAALVATDQQVLLNANAEGLAMGMKMQKARGSMPCSEVHTEMLKAVDKLRDS